MPVIQSGELFCTDLRLIIFETTVQIDAPSIKISPNEKEIAPEEKFIEIIPQNPIIAPIILNILNFSLKVLKKSKKCYTIRM